jgi:phosphopantothenoylcysteine decarboxylase/phosphopantothenate--cysteine ligase
VALAEAALARGARVMLLAAAVEVPLPTESEAVQVIRVETAADLRAALASVMKPADGPAVDALVMAAAVADFTPATPAATKLARGEGLTLALSPTPDLLAEVARDARAREARGDQPRPVLVGFAAETGSLDRAISKVAAKGVDLLVANDVAAAGSGFGTDTNRVSILNAAGGRDDLALLSKREVADRILDRVARALDERDGGVQTGDSTTGAGRDAGQVSPATPGRAAR